MTSHTLSRRCASLSLSLLLGASLLGGFLFFVSSTWAAPGNPVLDPPRNLVSAPPTTAVSITYDESIDGGTVNSRTFAVHGMQSGLVTGTHGVVDGGHTIIVTPTRPFHQGELVYAIATTGTLNVTGTEPAVATQWQFNAGLVDPRCVGGFVEDATATAGLTGVDNGSVDWGDYDGDGDLDILLTGWSSDLTARVYENEAGVFTDVGAGLTGVGWSSAAWGDYDGDGDLDILMTGLGVESSSLTRVALVYRNDGGSFTDITAGLTGVAWSDVAWGDYDNDGDLDIVLTGSDGSDPVALIYENIGEGFAEDLLASGNLAAIEDGSAAWGDYDIDGHLDLLLTGREQSGDTHARLYRNEEGEFTEVDAGLTGVQKGSAAWGDYDEDGDLDILLTGSRAARPTTLLYENDGGSFSEVSDAGLRDVGDGSEGTWGDYDNDGDLDILLTGSDGSSPVALVYENTDTGFAEDVTASANLFGVRYSSAAWGDYDGDGDLDVLLAGEDQSYSRRTALYRNVDCTDVAISKSVTPELVASGGALTYTLTVSNAGPSPMLAPIVVTDTLPDGMSAVNAAGCDVSALPMLTCTLSGGLDVGQRQEITITGSAPVTPGVITNAAGASTTLRDVSMSNNSATVTSTVAHLVDLEVVKQGPASIDPSESLTYTVVITNLGPNPASGVVVTDSIQNGALNAYESPPAWSCAIESPGTFSNSITCDYGGTIEPGGAEPITFTAQAPSAGGMITNTVTVRDGDNADRWLLNNSSVHTAHVNFPPTITVPFEAYETDENVTKAITFTVGDVETPLDSLMVAADVADATLIQDVTFSGTGADRTATITPTPEAYGSTVITFTVGDEDGLSDSDAFLLTVKPVNDAPTITVPFGTYETDEDVTTTIAFAVGDIDTPLEDLTLTGDVSDTTLVENVTFGGTGVDRTATITPAADAYGSTVITFTVSDGALSDSDAFTLTVNEVNDPPTALDDGVTVLEDSGPTGIDVLDNDTAEPDDDGPLGIQAVAAASNGTTAWGGGVVTYTPDANFAGSDAFTYTVEDTRGLTATATVAVTVTEVNDPPTITVPYETYWTDEDVSAVITFTVGDVETSLGGLILGAEASDPRLMATVERSGTGAERTATITTLPDAYGTAVITFTVSDGALSDSDAFTLTVNEVNDPPTAGDDTATVAEDSVDNEIHVLLNDSTAPDAGETLSIQSVGSASNGATAAGGGMVTYTPDADFAGSDAFTYTVSDGRGLTATATVAVTVTEVNDPPTITVPYEAYWTDEDVPAVITFTVGDVETSPGGLILGAEASDPRLMATVERSGAGAERTATITALPDAHGTTVITFTVSDGALSDSDAFTLTVNEVNDPPTAVDDTATVAEDSAGNEIWVLLNDSTAPDTGETKSVQSVGPAANGTAGVSATDVVTYTPDPDFVGLDTFTYTMNDGRGLTATATVSVTVTAEPEAPTLSVPEEAYTTDEDVVASVPFVVGDADTPLGDLSVTAEASEAGLVPPGSVVFSGTGADRVAEITPAENAHGTTVITLTVSDGALSGGDAFTLNVTPVNDPPAFGSQPVGLTAADEPYTYTIAATDPDAGDVLEIVGPVLPSWLTLTDNGDGTAVLTGTPTASHVGEHDVELRVRDNGGLVDIQAFVITVEPTVYRLYLPLAAQNHVAAPDLTVESLVASTSGITVTIKNAGNAAIEELFTNEFWVDVYIDPDVPPTEVNQTWEMVGGEGLAWGVTVDALPLAPGDTLTLVSGGLYYRPDESEVSWPLTPGTPIYAQVDSAHVETAHGTVWEIHELIDGAYNNIFGPAAVSSAGGGTPTVLETHSRFGTSHLPPRPRATEGSSLVE